MNAKTKRIFGAVTFCASMKRKTPHCSSSEKPSIALRTASIVSNESPTTVHRMSARTKSWSSTSGTVGVHSSTLRTPFECMLCVHIRIGQIEIARSSGSGSRYSHDVRADSPQPAAQFACAIPTRSAHPAPLRRSSIDTMSSSASVELTPIVSSARASSSAAAVHWSDDARKMDTS